jgi:hypothetical protein
MGLLRASAKLALVVGIGVAGAGCQDDDNIDGTLGGYQIAQGNYSGNYNNQQRKNNSYYQNGRRYKTVTVTNRGQNGYPDHVVQQKVLCGSQYYDGYRQRIARC